MMQTVRCIRFGEVLLDKNRTPFLLCHNCHEDFVDLYEFRKHLDNCNGLENLFRKNAALVFDSTKGTQLFGKAQTGELKEYRVYEPSEVQKIEAVEQPAKLLKEDGYIDLYKIEEEMLDPRWYSDPISMQPTIINTEPQTDKMLEYNELVEAVTPYVQFKENVKTYAGSSRTTRSVSDQSGATIVKQTTQKSMVVRRLDMLPASGSNNELLLTNVASANPKPVTTFILSMDNLEQQHIVTPKMGTQPPALARRKPIAIPMESVIIEPQLDADYSLTTRSTLSNYQVKKSCTATNPVPPLVKLSHSPAHGSSTVSTVTRITKQQRTLPTKVTRPAQTQSLLEARLLSTKGNTKSVVHQVIATTSNGHSAPPPIALPSLSPTAITVGPAQPPPKTKQTEQILNKLQTLGLQVKRTNPPPIIYTSNSADTAKTDETKELLKKLRSKGMNVKILNKHEKSAQAAAAAKRPKMDNIAAEDDAASLAINQVK